MEHCLQRPCNGNAGADKGVVVQVGPVVVAASPARTRLLREDRTSQQFLSAHVNVSACFTDRASARLHAVPVGAGSKARLGSRSKAASETSKDDRKPRVSATLDVQQAFGYFSNFSI